MKILVVGLGSMGKRRIRNMKHLNAGEIFGFDPREDRRKEAVEKLGIETFEDFDVAMEQKFDAMVISTPPNLHMQFAKIAAERGIHFFTEAGISNKGVQEVIDISAINNVVAAPSCTLRFHPSIKRMKKLVDYGHIGKILTFTYESGQYLPDWHPWEDYRTFYVSKRETGACREIVPFELTWVNWVMGNVTQVTAMKGKLSDLDCDIDDAYHLLMRYENGAIGHLLVDVLARAAVRNCRFIGTTGTLEWVASEKLVRHYDTETKSWAEYPEPRAEIAEGYSEMSVEGMYIEEMDAFIQAAKGLGTYPHTYSEDLRILDVLYASEKGNDENIHVKM